MRVLYALSKYPQLSETYVSAEIAFMLRSGINVQVWSPFERVQGIDQQCPVHRGVPVAVAAKACKADLVHVHHMSVSPGVCKGLEELKVPVTVRGHSFDFALPLVHNVLANPKVRRLYLFPHFARQVVHEKVIALPVAFDSTKYTQAETKDRMMVLRLGAGLSTKNLGDFFAISRKCPGFRFILGLASCDDEGRVANALLQSNPSSGVSLFKDVSWDAAEKLTRRAGIFLHTYDAESHPFGMPISIAESLATGSIVLVRDTMAAREYAGDAAFYYATLEEAIETINTTLAWPQELHDRQRARAVLQGSLYADKVVLPRVIQDWEDILGGGR